MIEQFFTRQTANEGVELPLYYPDGTKSEHWLKVRGVDSDQFRQAETIAKRKSMEIAQVEDIQERAEMVREAELSCIASLIAGWSFDQELTQANIMNFLREAPQIADMVNRFAAQRTEFYRKKSNSSSTGLNQK